MPSPLIQWFPGHMAKTRRIIAENLKYVDIVIELRDARIPQSSANPELHSIVGEKPVLHIFSKSKLADPKASIQWKKELEKNGNRCLFIDSLTSEGIGQIKPEIDHILVDKLARYRDKGMHGRTLKAMVVGIPNVRKSCLINRIAAQKKAKVENRPGVTLTKQWVTTSIGLDLMDMPGVLWPKFDDQKTAEKLAICGSIKDDILDTERLAVALCAILRRLYPQAFACRYKIPSEVLVQCTDYVLFEQVARSRGLLLRGGNIDTDRCSNLLLDEFRQGKIGRITLEHPFDIHSTTIAQLDTAEVSQNTEEIS